MEEKIIKGSVNLKKALIGCIIFIVGTFILLQLISLPEIIDGYNYRNECISEYYQELAEWENGERYWKPSVPYCMEESAFIYALTSPILSPITLIIWPTLSIIGSLIFIWAISKMQLIVTDKRVTGTTYFGRGVDLPMDSISAVGTSWFKGIAVSTSSGKISFLLIQNAKEIHETIRNLLIERQEQKEKAQAVLTAASSTEELKKYKELLDSGIITQEEFEAKKKQLLGL